MTIAFLIVLALAIGMAVAIYFQVKASHQQNDKRNQLLADYQLRVDELEKLLADYHTLEKNYEHVGEDFEQTKAEVEKEKEELEQLQQHKEALEDRYKAMQQEYSEFRNNSQQATELVAQGVAELQQLAKAKQDRKLMAVIGKITDADDVKNRQPLSRTDNVLVSQIAGEAIGISGIDKIDYLTFNLQIAPDAAATMLSTNLDKAVRALTHLLDNAMKFTQSGSVNLRIAVDMMKMQAIYTVEDTGTGITASDEARIFEPYVKLNQFFDGRGIGLSVARNIARRLGGDVVLDTTYEAAGSRFVLTLPI